MGGEAEMNEDIVNRFHLDMVNAYQACSADLGYTLTLVSQHMSEYGAVETAHWLVNRPHETSGLAKLWEVGRLDLSTVALVLKPEFAPLFSVEVRRTAHDTLMAYGYDVSPGITRP